MLLVLLPRRAYHGELPSIAKMMAFLVGSCLPVFFQLERAAVPLNAQERGTTLRRPNGGSVGEDGVLVKSSLGNLDKITFSLPVQL